MQFIDLQAQYKQLKNSIDKRIQGVLDHGKYIMGPEVLELEEKLADYVGVKHAVTCANGTDALQLCLMTLDINAGDAVFCPTFTFFATAEVIAVAGATPVFVDSDADSFNICPVHLEQQIEKTLQEGRLNLKAIIAVDLFGLPADYSKVKQIASKYNLELIEDAAQGFGGEVDGNKAGSFGALSTTSFFPAKPLGCYGDGGAIFTDNDELAKLLRSFRVHGQGSDKYDNVRIGLNSRLDTIQAAILLEKLSVFPAEVDMRNEIAQKYSSQLGSQFSVPKIPTGFLSSWAQYSLVSDNRDFYIDKLKENNIPSAIYYKTCMHEQSAFQSLGYQKTDLPVASRLSKMVFSLPMFPLLTDDEIKRVIEALID